MNTLVIAVTTGKGGKEFDRECNAFCEYWQAKPDHNIEWFKMAKTKPSIMLGRVLNAVEIFGNEQINRIVFFCHGTWKHLKCGFNIWNVDILAEALRPHVEHKIDIVLYACSCGSMRAEWPWRLTKKIWPLGDVLGQYGFAARLEQACLESGYSARIYAHGSRGHTTRNPYCYLFQPGIGGSAIVRLPIVKRSSLCWKTWKQKLQTEQRFEAPFIG